MHIKDLVGKRALLKIGSNWDSPGVLEYRVIEISPSENWVKLMNINGLKFWTAINDVAFVEELKEFKNKKED